MVVLPDKQAVLRCLLLWLLLLASTRAWVVQQCSTRNAARATGMGVGVGYRRALLCMNSQAHAAPHVRVSPFDLGKFLRGKPQLLVFHKRPREITPFKLNYLEKQEEFSRVFTENANALSRMSVSQEQHEANQEKLSANLEQARMQRQRRLNQRKPRKQIVSFPDFGVMQLAKLGEILGMDPKQIQRYLLTHKGLALERTTSSIDVALAKEVARMAGYPVRDAGEDFDEKYFQLEHEREAHDDSGLQQRPPVVTIMGHVDHGKTTLLDTIRKTMVAKTEAGGITQHTNAYQIHTDQGDAITFVDTPGHEAFRGMRERGARVTDLVVLVVAADDGVKTQTKEVINIINSHNLPLVVCITKMDKRDVKPDRILADLMSYGIVVEQFGGDTQVAKISATRHEGIDELLEKILVQAELLDLKSNPSAPASGTVVEAQQTSNRGSVVQVLVQEGTLRVGDVILAGHAHGRIKEMFNSSDHSITEAGAATPVHVTGMNGVPKAGDTFSVMENEDLARTAAETRELNERHGSAQSSHTAEKHSVLDILKAKAAASSASSSPASSKQQLPLKMVVKADGQGSLEALLASLQQVVEEDELAACRVQVVSSAVGQVTKNDINLAQIAKADLLAYGVEVKKDMRELARMKGVSIDQHQLLHDAVHGCTEKAKTIIKPPTPGKYLGRATVKQIFMVNKVEAVAGCQVADGIISATARVRILRGNRNELYRGPISSLRVVREEVSEVRKGQECGIMCDPNLQLQAGDIIECFEDPNAPPNPKSSAQKSK